MQVVGTQHVTQRGLRQQSRRVVGILNVRNTNRGVINSVIERGFLMILTQNPLVTQIDSNRVTQCATQCEAHYEPKTWDQVNYDPGN